MDKRTFRVLLTAVVFFLCIALLYFARHALVAFVFALFFAYLLQPLVKLAQPFLRDSRGAAILVAYLLTGAVVWIAVSFFGTKVQAEFGRVVDATPKFLGQLESGEAAGRIGARAGLSWRVQSRMRQALIQHKEALSRVVATVAQYGARAVPILIWLVVIPILAIWVLKDKDRWLARLAEAPPTDPAKIRWRAALREIDRALARYIWAQLVLALLAFGAFAIVLSILQFPNALLLAAIAGLAEVVFVLGPLTAAALVLGVALFHNGGNWVAVFIFLGAWRIVQDYVNVPLLLGRRLELHPLVVVFVLVVGWEISGAIGMFLAVPIAAAVQIIWEAFSRNGNPGRDLVQFLEREAA